MAEQATKAVSYFDKALAAHTQDVLACQLGGTVLVVCRGDGPWRAELAAWASRWHVAIEEVQVPGAD